MERLDFASVVAVLGRNFNEESCSSQIDRVCALLGDVILKYRCRILFTTHS